jgi:hypothetical protein
MDQMKRYMVNWIVRFAVVGAVLFGALAVQAQTVPGKDGAVPPSAKYVSVNRQTAVMCNLCFTCGGDWGVFAGSFASSGTNNVTERGSSCSGALTSRTDSRPFLCCR